MQPDVLALAIVAIGTGAAAVIDLRVRRVPNALTASVAAAGLALAAADLGPISLTAALAGGLMGLALMLPGHLLGGTGGGDVKLLASVGTVLGPVAILPAFVLAAIAGGAIALVVAARRGRVRQTFDRTTQFLVSAGANVDEITSGSAGNRFPYAPAIAVGAVLAAVSR